LGESSGVVIFERYQWMAEHHSGGAKTRSLHTLAKERSGSINENWYHWRTSSY
jgi:hypothetical protein